MTGKRRGRSALWSRKALDQRRRKTTSAPKAAGLPRLKVVAGFLSAAVLAAVTAKITGLTDRTIAAVVERTHPSVPFTITGERPEPLPPPTSDSALSVGRPAAKAAGRKTRDADDKTKDAGGTADLHAASTAHLISDGYYGLRREYEGLVVARKASAITPPSDDVTAVGLDRWIERYDAADQGETLYDFIVQGKPGRTVVVRRIRIAYVDRAAAPAVATVVRKNADTSGGSTLSTRYFSADLDDPLGRLRPVGDTSDFPFRISNDDPEPFSLSATTRRCDCHWRILIDWTSNGRDGTASVGETFHTTPQRHYPELAWGPTLGP